MMKLKLVKTSSKEYLHSPEEHNIFLHGNKVMLNLLQPYVNNQQRIVSVYSYFASMQACDKAAEVWIEVHWCGEDSNQSFLYGTNPPQWKRPSEMPLLPQGKYRSILPYTRIL